MQLNVGAVKSLATLHCFRMHNDQTLIQNQTLNDSRVFFWQRLPAVFQFCGSLGSEHVTGILCTAHVAVPCGASGCPDLRRLYVQSALLETLWFHYGKQRLSILRLAFVLQNVSIEIVIFAVRCRMFDFKNCCLQPGR